VTNVSAGGRPVKRPATGTGPGPEALEISRLLVEVLRVGDVGQRTGPDPETAGAGGAPTAGDGSVAAAPETTGPASAHVIRAAIHIHDEGPQTIGQLAQGLGISQGWASRVVDELERAGYVERERDPADRRVVRVRLTPMAVERVERAYQWRGGAVEAALTGMDARERAAVAAFLRRFVESVRATAGQDGGRDRPRG
jgi:DNA-binding MarR family transcriptional regulator